MYNVQPLQLEYFDLSNISALPIIFSPGELHCVPIVLCLKNCALYCNTLCNSICIFLLCIFFFCYSPALSCIAVFRSIWFCSQVSFFFVVYRTILQRCCCKCYMKFDQGSYIHTYIMQREPVSAEGHKRAQIWRLLFALISIC